jgi:hypothetical protein
MSSDAGSALPKALALLRAPRGARLGPGDSLPDGLLLLLRIVAGEEQAMVIAQESTREPIDKIREAAGFYIQQVMFATGSSSYRVLGVDPDAGDERLREHYRWLARWLHPDRNPDKWEVVYAERVNQAWQDLRTPERRLRYDQQLREAQEAPLPGEPRETLAVVRRAAYMEPAAAPGWNLRWLPTAIFGGLGVSAILIVALLFVLRWAEPGPEQVSTRLAVAEDSAATPVAPASEDIEDTGTPESAIDLRELEQLAASLTPADSVEEAAVAPSTPANFESEAAPLAVADIPTPAAAAPEAPLRAVATPVSPTVAASVLPARVRKPERLPEPKPRTLAVASPPPAVVRPEVKVQSVTRTSAARPDAKARSVTRTTPRSEAKASRANKVAAVEAPPADSSVSAEPAPPPAPARAQIDERDANRLLGHFSRAYAEGNLAGMKAMFTSDVSSPRGGLDAILAEYDRLFETSEERFLAVRDVTWFANGATLTIIASYQATVTTGRSRRQRRTHGDLRLDLRRENEQWRIYRMQHDERPG